MHIATTYPRVKVGDPAQPWNGNTDYWNGALCTHKGKTWRCTAKYGIHNPAFEPGGFAPFGWEIV